MALKGFLQTIVLVLDCVVPPRSSLGLQILLLGVWQEGVSSGVWLY